MKQPSTIPLANLQNLLQSVSQISSKYEEIQKVTGEGFNVFSILRLDSHENSHSLILAELLNAQGCHAQGDLFLREFLDVLRSRLQTRDGRENGDWIEQFETSDSRAMTEYHIGFIDGDHGGRIDILIRDNPGREIVIENKVYANLQDRQLERYKNYAKGNPVLFLTLFPNDFREILEGLPADQPVIKISYKEEILEWLDRCLRLATSLPQIRETISQYMNLIKELTHQNTSKQMSQEIAKLILQDRTAYDSYCMIKKTSSTVTQEIFKKLDGQITEHLKDRSIQKVTNLCNLNGTVYEGFYFGHPLLEKHNLHMGFQFNSSNFRYLCYGIGRLTLPETETDKNRLTAFETQLATNFSNVFPEAKQSLPWWPSQVLWSEFKDWDDETFAQLLWGDLSARILKIVSGFEQVLQKTEALQAR